MPKISDTDQQEINNIQDEIESIHQYIIRLEEEKDALDDPWDREIVDGNICDEHYMIQSLEYRIQEILEQYEEDEE